MIQCGQCGTANDDGTTFCGECGEYLEWSGAQVAAPATTPAATGVEAGATPEVVQPGEERRVPLRREPDRDPVPGETPCRKCGAGNAPGRRFCRACGTLLAPDGVARRSWWRRFLSWCRARLGGRRYEAGTRRRVPVQRSGRRGLLLTALLLLLVVVFVALVPARPLLQSAATALRDRFSQHVPVTVVAQRASSSAPGTNAGRIADGAANRYWAPAGRPAGAWVEAAFAQPVRLLEIIVTPGVSTDQQQFLAQGRPHQLAVTVDGRSGRILSTTLTLQDKAGAQRFPVKASGAVRVRLTILSAYGIPPGHVCAIGELEFFGR